MSLGERVMGEGRRREVIGDMGLTFSHVVGGLIGMPREAGDQGSDESGQKMELDVLTQRI